VSRYIANLISTSGKSIIKIIESDGHEGAMKHVKEKYPHYEIVRVVRECNDPRHGMERYLGSINKLR